MDKGIKIRPVQLVTRLSPSQIETWQTCQMMWYWKYGQGLSPVGEDRTAMDFGTMMHSCMDIWFETRERGAVLAKMGEWKDRIGDDKRTLFVGQRLLGKYMDRYQDDGMENVKSRIKFEIPIEEFVLNGELDRVVRWMGRLYVMEHKTTWAIDVKDQKRVKPNWQFDFYIWAMRKMGMDVRDGLMDFMQVAKTRWELLRQDTARTDEELEQFEREVVRIGRQMNQAIRDGVFSPSKAVCSNFYNRVCPYHGIDEWPEGMRGRAMQSGYVRREREVVSGPELKA